MTEIVLYPKDRGAVRVRIFDRGHAVTVTAVCEGWYGWWVCPDATTLRRLVDSALKGSGRKRVGTRVERQDLNHWWFEYAVA